MVPVGVMRPIRFPASSVNHRLPSGPAVIPWGLLPDEGTATSVTVPVGVMRPIWFPASSVNHRLPSGPAVIPRGSLPDVGSGKVVMVPVGVMRPIWFPWPSVNQRLPSRPAVIPSGSLPGVGIANSVILPADGAEVLFDPPVDGVLLLVLVGFVLAPVPPQAVRRTMRSPSMPMQTNLWANCKEIRIKVTPFVDNNVKLVELNPTIKHLTCQLLITRRQSHLQVLFCRTCWINPHSTGGGEEGVLRGHLALRQRAAALCTPACWPLLHRPDQAAGLFKPKRYLRVYDSSQPGIKKNTTHAIR